jgi:hypothetical protein
MMELTLPELTDLNTYIQAERGNRFMASKLKKQNTFIVSSLAMQQLPRLKKITKVTFIWKHKNKRKDMDNVEFSQKFIWDGLVQAKVIPNDNWKYRPARTLHKHEVNKDHPGVIVVLKGEK